MSDEQPETNDFKDFVERVDQLLEEARRYGIASVAILFEDDPIANKNTRQVLYKGGCVLAVGMVELAKTELVRYGSKHDE